MKVLPYFILGFFSFLLLFTCTDEPDFPVIPKIDFVSIGKNVLKQGLNGDTTTVTIYFEDGDGDLGGEPIAIFIIDKRSEFLDSIFRIPEIPLEGVSSSISGEIDFPIPSTCCIYDNGQIPCSPSTEFPQQELIYEIYIKDRSGNQSNRIELPAITLLCE